MQGKVKLKLCSYSRTSNQPCFQQLWFSAHGPNSSLGTYNSCNCLTTISRKKLEVSFLKEDLWAAIEGTCWITNLHEQLLSAGICLTWWLQLKLQMPTPLFLEYSNLERKIVVMIKTILNSLNGATYRLPSYCNAHKNLLRTNSTAENRC